MPASRRPAARASKRPPARSSRRPPAPGSKRTPAHLVTRAEMARRLGLSKAAVTKACREGGRLAPACQGTAVNALHPAAQSWLAQRAAARAEAAPLVGAVATVPELDAGAVIPVEGAAADAPELDELTPAPVLSPWQLGADLAALEQPLTELTERYGSAEAFAGWVKCRKLLEDARRAEMLRERVAGRLIARTTVLRMLDHVDAAFRILLSDLPRTVATRLGCADLPGASAVVRDLMSQQLEAAQSHMAASLEADDPMQPLAEAAE